MRHKTSSRPSDRIHAGRIRRLHNHPFVVPVVTFLVLFFVSMVGYISLNSQTIGASDTRIVVLSIDAEKQIVPTRAENVDDLLKRLNIKLGPDDIINPALDTTIDKDNFYVKIYRARPVIVEDGSNQKITYTAQPTPEAIVETAGVQVYPEDKLKVTPATNVETEDLLREGIVAEKIVVDRATLINLNLYGIPLQIRTHADNIAELLAEKNVRLNEGDTLQPEASTTIVANIQIFVTRVGIHIASDDLVIPAPVEIREDPTLLAGTERVLQAGSNGRRVVTYELELRNGAEASRRVIQEVIASEPVRRIVVKGTKVIYSNPSANVELGKQIAADMGWTKEFSCIYTIFNRESKWNQLARNRSSGAYGIPQALPGSKMGSGWESDPAVQIRWGIGYMVNRYGSPCKANNFLSVNNWY